MNQIVWDSDRQRQYESISTDAAWIDIGARTEIAVLGRDRLQVMNNFCTADLKVLAAGQGAEAFVLNVKGMTIGHVAIFVRGDQVDISTVARQASALIPHFRQYVISEKVDFVDRSAELRTILVAGPKADKVLDYLHAPPPAAERMNHTLWKFGAGELMVRRTDLLGATGLAILGDSEAIGMLQSKLQASGWPECSPAVLESKRLENQIPLYGVDIDEKNLLQELGRDLWAVSFTKGCYLGQETVARLDALGHVNRLWVGLVFDSDTIPRPGFVITQDDKPVARVTSAAWSPQHQRPLAQAFVRHGFHLPGTRFSTDLGTATVVPGP